MPIRKGLNQVAASTLLSIRDKLGVDAPTKGVQVGGGIHVPMPDAWDGVGRVPLGYTGTAGIYEEDGAFSVGLPEDIEDRLSVDSDLTGPERAEILTEFNEAKRQLRDSLED